jgi:hypothetical protein
MPRQYTSEMNNKELFWHTLSWNLKKKKQNSMRYMGFWNNI